MWWCSVLRCVSVCSSRVQRGALRCSVLQRVAACYRLLQCVAACCSVSSLFLCAGLLWCMCACLCHERDIVSVHQLAYCSVLQCAAVYCTVLQSVTVCCSVLQYVAVCCRAAHPLYINLLWSGMNTHFSQVRGRVSHDIGI